MGKAGKWIRNLFTGSKKEKSTQPSSSPLVVEIPGSNTTPATPKEKKRWSFRRSTAAKEHHHLYMGSVESVVSMSGSFEAESEHKRHALAVAVATAAAADAAVAAAQATAAVIRMRAAAPKLTAVEEAAAVKIQSAFRACLARKALRALKGLVKLQALVRGHLVRKQASATLKCMQALVTAQARARVRRIKMSDESQLIPQRRSPQRRSPQDSRFRKSHEWDRIVDENIKIVEMDMGDGRRSSKSRYSYSPTNELDKADHQPSADQYYSKTNVIPIFPKLDHQFQISPSPSALTDMSPGACSSHFEEYSYVTTQSSPQFFSTVAKQDPDSADTFSFPKQDYPEPMSAQMQYPFFPGYMANTESSRAKVRSQSAPKQRPEAWERQPSARRRPSMEGRNMIPRGVRMQRSSSQVGSSINNYHCPWSIKLDRSVASIKDGSECGSTSTALTNPNYCRSLVGFQGNNGSRY